MKSDLLSLLTVIGLALPVHTTSGVAQGAVEIHVAAARGAATQEHATLFESLCASPVSSPRSQPLPTRRQGPPDRATWHADPVKVFDNLFYVGMTEYSAWAITTSAGIIIIDPLFDYSVEDEVVNGLTTLGLDPKMIKYVIVSHGHRDHVGGARYLQDRFGAHVVLSAADWDLINRSPSTWPKPKKDIVATDGQQLVLGDTTLTLYLTPGHTLGTISTLIPVKDGRSSHMAILWGGTGFNWLRGSAAYIAPETPASFWFRLYSNSAKRLREIVLTVEADVLLSNHPTYDGSKTKLPAVSKRRLDQPHPYVIGNDSVRRFLTVAEECATAGLLRIGQ